MKHTRGGGPSRVDPESAVLIGGLLRDRRRGLGLTPEEVGEAIRFGTRQIVAVEEGRFSDLPPQPYARGLVSAYANLVGIAPEELLRFCGPAFSGEAGDQRTSVFRFPARDRFSWREWTVPFALAAAVGVLVIARAVLEPAPEVLSVPVTIPAWRLRPIPEATSPADISSPPADAAEEPAAVPGVRVIVRSEGTTWAEATPDGADQRRYELGPGQSLEITARERLSMSLGDAGVVRVNVNGRELGYIGFKGELKSGLLFTAPKPAHASAPVAADGD
jgi:hypothetical protein